MRSFARSTRFAAIALLALTTLDVGRAEAQNARDEARLSYSAAAVYDGQLEATCTTRLADLGPSAEVGLAIHHAGGELVIRSVSGLHPDPTDASRSIHRSAILAGEETVRLDPGQVTVALASDEGMAVAFARRVAIVPDEDLSLMLNATFSSPQTVVHPVDSFSIADQTRAWFDSPVSYKGVGPRTVVLRPLADAYMVSGHRLIETRDSESAISGDVEIYLRDASLSTEAQAIPTGTYKSQEAPLVQGAAAATQYREAFLRLVDATIQLPKGTDGLYCRDLAGSFTGIAVIDDAAGQISSRGIDTTLERQRFAVDGQVVLQERTRVRNEGQSWYAEGQWTGTFHSSAVDHVEIPTPRLPVSPIAATGILALAAAIMWKAADVYAFLYARVQPESVLRHPARRRLAGIVENQPGLSLLDLAAAAGIPLSTVRHHVRVLERAGHLALIRNGRCVRVLGPRLPPLVQGQVLARRDARFAALMRILESSPKRQVDVELALAGELAMGRRGAREVIASAESHQLIQRDRSASGVFVRPSSSL